MLCFLGLPMLLESTLSFKFRNPPQSSPRKLKLRAKAPPSNEFEIIPSRGTLLPNCAQRIQATALGLGFRVSGFGFRL